MTPVVSMITTGIVALVGGTGAAFVTALFGRGGKRADAADALTRGASEMTDRVFKLADRESAEAVELRMGYRRIASALVVLIEAVEHSLDTLPDGPESKALRAAVSVARAALMEYP